MPGKRKTALTKLEGEVMRAVWDAEPNPVRVREVMEALNKRRRKGLAYNTVQTMLTILRTNSTTGRMERRRSWGGVLAENVTQAVARDVMVEGMKRLDVEGYHPILTVHDEIICEPNVPDPALDKFLSIMSEAPEWATGLPVFADGFVAARYRKG